MKRRLFARSPGLVFASASLFSGGLKLEELDHSKLEAQERLVKLSTGSPSLSYDLEIAEENEPEVPYGEVGQVEFGLDATDGVIVRDGYPFEPPDAPERSLALALPNGYYRIRLQALPTVLDGQMRVRLSVRPSSIRLPERLADLDYMPPAS